MMGGVVSSILNRVILESILDSWIRKSDSTRNRFSLFCDQRFIVKKIITLKNIQDDFVRNKIKLTPVGSNEHTDYRLFDRRD